MPSGAASEAARSSARATRAAADRHRRVRDRQLRDHPADLAGTQLFTGSHGKTAATQLALLLYVGYNIAAALVGVPAGRHGDRHDPVRVLAVGAVLFTVCYGWFAARGHRPLVLLAAFILTELGIGCGETAESAAVASLASVQLPRLGVRADGHRSLPGPAA